MENTLNKTAPAPSSVLRLRLWLCFLVSVLIGLNDGGVGVLLLSLMRHYNVDKSTISLMFLAATLGYLCAAFSSGPLLERLGRRSFSALGAGLFALALGVLTLAPPFPLFLAALFCSGSGYSLLEAAVNSFVASMPNNTGPLNYLHAFYGGGALIGPVVASGVLALGLGWNYVYFIWLTVALVALVGCVRLFDNARSSHAGEGNVLAATMRLPLVWLAAAFLFVYVGAEVSVGSWGFAFLTQERHGPELLSAWTISGYWLGLTVGRIVLGKLAARIGNRRLIEFCLGGVVAAVLLVWWSPNEFVAALGLFITGFSLGPIFPTTLALISDIVAPRLLPSSISFAASFGSVGAALAPYVVGNMADAIGLWTLLPFVIALTAVMVMLWLALSKRRA